MRIERRAIVRGAAGECVELEPVGACDGCACSGRCAFGGGARRLAMPRAAFVRAPAVGDVVRLAVEPDVLRRLTLALHGRMLAGLVLGAAAGGGLASLLHGPIDGYVAAGAGLGTLVALLRSQQSFRALVPRIEILENEPDPCP